MTNGRACQPLGVAIMFELTVRVVLVSAGVVSAAIGMAAEGINLEAAPRAHAVHRVDGVNADAECFSIDVEIDPVAADGGDMQVVAGFAIGVGGRPGMM